jgi:hypothetical protein
MIYTRERPFMSYKIIFGTLRLPIAVPRGKSWTAALFLLGAVALQAQNPCDLTSAGIVSTADINAAISIALGQVGCAGNVLGLGTCNVVVLQRVVNASLSGACFAGQRHTVSITWTPSSSTNVIGYNVYRATTLTGQFVKLTTSPVPANGYADSNVQAGQTYIYAATSVDDLGNESVPTAQFVIVPYP